MVDPIVFIPGLNCTAALFASQIESLRERGPVFVADHTGHDTIAGIAGAVLAAAPPRFVLAGLSMGGYVALEIMRQAHARVSGLVLMDTTARPDTAEAAERRRRLIAIAEAGRFGEIADLQAPTLLAPARAEDPELRALIRRMAEETGPGAFVRQQKAVMGRPDSRPLLPEICCPTLVIVGSEDQLTPPEMAREMAEAVPGARLRVIEAAGHFTTIEDPGAVNAELDAFLREMIVKQS